MEAHTALPGGRVALVHDFLLDLRGAERVFLEMCALWPEAPLFTAVYDEEGTEGRFAQRPSRRGSPAERGTHRHLTSRQSPAGCGL